MNEHQETTDALVDARFSAGPPTGSAEPTADFPRRSHRFRRPSDLQLRTVVLCPKTIDHSGIRCHRARCGQVQCDTAVRCPDKRRNAGEGTFESCTYPLKSREQVSNESPPLPRAGPHQRQPQSRRGTSSERRSPSGRSSPDLGGDRRRRAGLAVVLLQARSVFTGHEVASGAVPCSR